MIVVKYTNNILALEKLKSFAALVLYRRVNFILSMDRSCRWPLPLVQESKRGPAAPALATFTYGYKAHKIRYICLSLIWVSFIHNRDNCTY